MTPIAVIWRTIRNYDKLSEEIDMLWKEHYEIPPLTELKKKLIELTLITDRCFIISIVLVHSDRTINNKRSNLELSWVPQAALSLFFIRPYSSNDSKNSDYRTNKHQSTAKALLKRINHGIVYNESEFMQQKY